MFKIINLLIPNSKESSRCPNKNRLLRKYTLEYLQRELPLIEAEDKICIIWELRNENVPVDTAGDEKYSFKVNPLYIPDKYSEDMKPLLKYAESRIKGDIYVLLQLTQPERREGLVKDVIEKVIDDDTKLTTTYAETHGEAWRVIINENWQEQIRNRPEANTIKLYDGSCYGWSADVGSKCLWQWHKKKNFVKNGEKVVDIDFPEELETFLNL